MVVFCMKIVQLIVRFDSPMNRERMDLSAFPILSRLNLSEGVYFYYFRFLLQMLQIMEVWRVSGKGNLAQQSKRSLCIYNWCIHVNNGAIVLETILCGAVITAEKGGKA